MRTNQMALCSETLQEENKLKVGVGQLEKEVLLAMVTLLYIRSLELIYLI